MIVAHLPGGLPQAELNDPGQEPVLPDGANAAAIALFKVNHEIWKSRDEKWLRETKHLIDMKELVTQGFDTTMENTIRAGDDDIATIPLRTILTRLRTECNKANINVERELKDIISRKIRDDEYFKDYKAEKMNALRDLTRMGIRFEPNPLFDIFQNGIFGEDKKTWCRHPMLQTMFMHNYPTRETRTADALCDMLTTHEEHVGIGIKAGELFAGAAKASGDKEDMISCTRSEFRKMIEEELRARRIKGKGGGGAGGGGGQHNGGGGSRRVFTPGPAGTPKTFLCSTHGWNWTHPSRRCIHKSSGHRDDENEAQRRIRLPGDPGNDRI